MEQNKLRNLITIASEDITTLNGVYTGSTNSGRVYTFKVMKKLAQLLTPEKDHVAVETNKGYSIVKVVEIHNESLIDFDDDIRYKWAFEKIHMNLIDSLNQKEELQLEKFQSAQRAHIRKQAQDMLNNEIAQTSLGHNIV